MQGCVFTLVHEYAGSGSEPCAHGHHSAGNETLILPIGSQHQTVIGVDVLHALCIDADVARLIHDVLGVFFKSNSGTLLSRPAFAERLEASVLPNAIVHPRGYAKLHTALAQVFNNLHLCNLWVHKIHRKVANCGVGTLRNHERYQAAVKHEFRTLTFDGEVFPTHQTNADTLALLLIVVGNIALHHGGICAVEVVSSLRQLQNHLVGG